MDAGRYLARIGYDGPRQASAEVLRALHARHMLSVPFENLDIGHRPIVIDETAFVEKIVAERRGGFCYELNGAFAALLRTFGFDVTLLSCGVARENGGFGPDFDHLALLVRADGVLWLADVGFGDSFVEPLRFETGIEQRDPAGLFRLTAIDGDMLLERRVDDAWKPQYRFTTKAHALEEYAARCHYHQTSDGSSFTKQTICSLATSTGRVTLSGLRLIVTEGVAREERMLPDDAAWRAALKREFGVVLPF